MAAFLRGKDQILWDVTVDTGYVQPMNVLAPGSRDTVDCPQYKSNLQPKNTSSV
jgi:hypothetical protein